MIPIRLNLQNFLAYRAPNPLVFDGIHLACLTGENGSGKSSLLDAITWAVWGKARARDNDLVHLGTSKMYVELDFIHEGQKYRINRSREKQGKRGFGRLQLFIYDADGQLNEISESSMNATQKRINALLRLDYDTFVNSAFLQQGEADAFTVKRPAERKQILANILGLEKWAEYEERAKEKLSGIKEKLVLLKGLVDEIDRELEKEPAYRQELAEAEAAKQHAEQECAEAEALLRGVANAPHDLKRTQLDLQNADAQRQNDQNQLDQLKAQRDARAKEIEKYAAIVEEREAIVEGYEALQAARSASEDLNKKYRELKKLDDQIGELTGQLNTERTQLAGERNALKQQIARLTEQIEASDAAECERVRLEIESLQGKAKERDALQTALSELDTENATLSATNKALRLTMNELKERIDALEAIEGAACPLCGQALTEDHRIALLSQLQNEGTGEGDTYRANEQRMQDIKNERTAHKSQIETLAVAVQPLAQLQTKMGQLQQQADDAAKATQKREERQKELAAVVAKLEGESFGGELRGKIAALTEKRDGLGYDETTHNAHNDTLETYRGYEERRTKLSVAETTLPQLREVQARQDQDADGLTANLKELAEKTASLQSSVADLTELVETYKERDAAVKTLRMKASQAATKLGAAQQAVKSLDDARKRRKDYEERRAESANQKAIYEELREAFGKNGVPAMIIEAAIPELENTTNDLLARITDGRMMVKFSMQREKITGGTAETLDIEIADELGTRSYDLYSGGEAFRINFAIRVALSKMLARRAGAHLETLFVDEGFGTQDADGRTKLVEAINAIQEEFKIILVITHIEELKDAFPIHIHVEKAPNGSQIYLR